MGKTIYIVVKSEGSYEDFRTTNLKAFYDKDEARKYIRKINISKDKLPFLTEEFEETYNEVIFDEPESETYPYFPILTSEDKEKYSQWMEKEEEKCNLWMVNALKEKGFDITLKDLADYYNYLNNIEVDYDIEEIELV